jgi:hypothetical protein
MLGLITIVPLQMWVSFKVVREAQAAEAAAGGPIEKPALDFWFCAASGSTEGIRQHIENGMDVNTRHDIYGATALSMAATYGQAECVQLLIDLGADVNQPNKDGSTPLHSAAFFGRVEISALLLAHGADWSARNEAGDTPLHATQADWRTTKIFAGFLQQQVVREEVEAGRTEIVRMILETGGEEARRTVERVQPRSWKDTAALTIGVLTRFPLFHHLWFLWFLCWLVPMYAVLFWIAGRTGFRGVPSGLRWVINSPARYLWLVPLTMWPQWTMGHGGLGFGPDTSIGLLPVPNVLGYYAIFFGFGIVLYETPDPRGQVGRWWWATLPASLLLLFPIGVEFGTGVLGFRDELTGAEWHRPLFVLLQVMFAWAMTFGFIGLFRKFLSRQRKGVRYLSDSSYWLYLTHLPLVIWLQGAIREWDLPAELKFVGLCAVVSALLLLAYDLVIRYTWVGAMLNGRKVRGDA